MKIALASCIKIQNQKRQPVWDEMQNISPDMLILAGDNVYGHQRKRKKEFLIDKYEKQYREHLSFKNFIHSMKGNIVSVWDDHDFGRNNSQGAKEPRWWKDFLKEQFVEYNWWTRDRIKQPEGIYHSHIKDGVKFIVLDVRWFRRKSCKFSWRNKDSILLGDTQWSWFEEEMKYKGMKVIVSGSCLTRGKDGWRKFKKERERLYDLLFGSGRVVFCSGDIHTNDCITYTRGNDHFVEIISSAAGRDNKNNWCEFVVDNIGVRDIEFHGKNKYFKVKEVKV